jgi:hypothetical protein
MLEIFSLYSEIFGVTSSVLLGSKTHSATLDRFAAHAAAARPFAIGGAFGLARASAALAAVAAPLRACAAYAACFAPPGSTLENHRQDQSILSVLVHLTGHPVVPFRGFTYNHDLDFALHLVSPRHAATYPCPAAAEADAADLNADAGDCGGGGGLGWEAVPVLWRLACHDAERCFRPAAGADPVCAANMCWATVAAEVEVNGRRGSRQLRNYDSSHLERVVYIDRALGLPAGAAVFAAGANYVVLRLIDAAGSLVAEARADFTIGVPGQT